MDLVGATFSLFCVNQFSSCVIYSCTCVEHMSASVCIDIIDRSSAYEEMYMLFGGVGMSCMYKLKSVGLKTEPCGTPFGKFSVVDDTPL